MSLVLPPQVAALRCVLCGFTHRDPWLWTCPHCGPESRMDVLYDADAPARMARELAAAPLDHWRYRAVMPIPEGAALPPLQVGWSPVHEAPRLAARLGLARVVVKDDGRNPSASLKDRASSVGVVMAVAAGKERITCASTGNAASSTACIAASMGLAATIFVPRRAPLPKIAQLRVFGAQVFRVDADYDTAWDLAAAVAARKPWFNRNCAINPYLVEGKKTVGLELAEQLGARMTPWVAISVGDGCTIAGLIKGLEEAHAAGLIPFVPRVLGVQAEGAAPLVHAFERGDGPQTEAASTVADSLCVGHPRNGHKALQAIRRNGGVLLAVPDAAILAALATLAESTGIFGEPAASATVAGVAAARARGILGEEDEVAVVVTGNGLKDPGSVLEAVAGPVDVAPSVDAVLAAL
ncbi:MAG: threonine synthase [Pseudomonadota bacterium]